MKVVSWLDDMDETICKTYKDLNLPISTFQQYRHLCVALSTPFSDIWNFL